MRTTLLPALILLTLVAAPARAAVVSGDDPLAGACAPRVDSGVPVEQGFDTRDTATGPAVAVDPRNARRIAVAWNQDFPQALMAAVSTDGGKRWRRSVVPGLSRCSGGSRFDAYDPAVTIAADGAILVGAIPADEPRVPVPPLHTELAVVRTDDDGRTWSRPAIVEPSTGFSAAEPALLADPRDPRLLVATWIHKPGAGTSGQMRAARSADGGRTWSAPTAVHPPAGEGAVPSGNALVRLPDGTLVLVGHTWTAQAYAPILFGLASLQGTPAERFPVWSVRSLDGGRTWSTPVELGDTASPLPRHPESGTNINVYNLPSATVDADGAVHAVWHSIESTRSATLQIASSSDGGRTWSVPRPVDGGFGWQAFSPRIAASRGALHLTWYDARADTRGDGPWTLDVRTARSVDGGRSWRSRRLSAPFDAMKLPVYREYGSRLLWLGFYQGLASGRRRATAAFTAPAPGTRAAVHVERLR